MSCIDNEKSPCGCCELPLPATPVVVDNRPGLVSISYRVGTYAAFRQAMVHAISQYPELVSWTVRTSDDYGIALIEMWAYLADILTFYQERIANEAYLRTAILPESVTRLAALLDYKLVPGVAASTYLAFTLEKDKEIQIPLGLRVQSVPGQNENPQKFETVEAIAARADINRLKIYPEPRKYNPFDKDNPNGNGTIGYLDPKSYVSLSSGDKFVIFSATNNSAEEKEVVKLKQDRGLTSLVWNPPIQSNGLNLENSYAYKFKQKYRLFGYNAPNDYLFSYPDKNNDIKWGWIQEGEVFEKKDEEGNTTFKLDYSFELSPEKPLTLDAVYDDLKKGMNILISVKNPKDPNSKVLELETMVTEVRRVPAHKGPMSATASKITIQPAISETINLRDVEIYRLDDEISFIGYYYPDKIEGNTFYLPSPQAEEIEPKRSLIIGDENGTPQVVTVTEVGSSVTDQGLKSITLDGKESLALDSQTAFIYGNVAKSTHGETVKDEVLGDGDASIGLQSFPISNSPVTFVHQAKATRGAASTLDVRVDGILWHEVNSLYGHSGTERIFTSEVDANGKMLVRFGDGINGARVASGSGNVMATYRKGSGRQGNVKAKSLKTLLDRPVGLKSVINPFDAEGGDDPEGLEDARINAPNTVRIFDRIVSLRDFEDAAREYPGVAKAKSRWYWDGEEQTVLLTVAGEDDADLDSTLKDLVDYLNARRDNNRKLQVRDRQKMYIQLSVEAKVDSDHVDEDVRLAATKALKDHLAFENINLGQSIHLSDLYLVLQRVDGVIAAHFTMLQFKYLSYLDLKKRYATFQIENGLEVPDIVQNHLYVFSEELIAIETPDADILVNPWSGE